MILAYVTMGIADLSQGAGPVSYTHLCLHISSVFNGSFNIKKMTLPEVTYTIPLVQKLLALANENHLTISKKMCIRDSCYFKTTIKIFNFLY